MNGTICEVKTKALISCAVTAQLICAFVFAYAKSRFSHDAALMMMTYLMSAYEIAYHIRSFKICSKNVR